VARRITANVPAGGATCRTADGHVRPDPAMSRQSPIDGERQLQNHVRPDTGRENWRDLPTTPVNSGTAP